MVLFAVIAITACQKESSEEFVVYPNNAMNDTVWASNGSNLSALNKIIIPQLIMPNISDSFNCLVDNNLIFGDSLQIIIPANTCINSNGGTITSGTKIKIDINLLRTKSDFIKYASPTTNVVALLEAGNFIDIKLSRDGQEVFLNPNSQAKIRIKDTAINNDMKFFAGSAIKYNADSLFSWSAAPNIGKVGIWKDNAGSSSSKILGYEFTTNKLRWIGSAYFTDSLQPKTRVNVTLPLNYTNKNTAVFAVFKSKKTVISLLNDAITKTFFALNIPINTEVTLVSLTKINNDYYLGSKVIKVTNSDPITVLPEKKTLAQIIEFLDKL
ncbi:MAG: hypothetical protein H7068_11005 [Pedobacter sp.]|nr:hypothetical protein [Chitinophagaceae bacterium]